MYRSRSYPRLAHPRRFAGSARMAALVTLLSSPAWASSCPDMQTRLLERTNLVSGIQAMTQGGKKMDAKAACAVFGKLAANGTTTLKWAEVNKDACRVPDQFVQGLTADHERVVKMRGLACDLASKQEAIEKKLEEMEKKGLPPGLGPGAPDLMPRPGTTRG